VGLTQPAAEPTDLRNLSDKELVKRFCTEAEDQPAADEIWRRYEQTIYKSLEKSSRTLCPVFYDPRDLVHDSYLKARENLLARICKFKELDSARSLRAWLGRVVRSTMLDERRKVTQSRKKRKIVEVSIEKPSGEDQDQGKLPEITEETLLEFPEVAAESTIEVEERVHIDTPVSFSEMLEPRSHHVYFRSRYSTSPLDPSAPVEWKYVEQQRKFIFREVLTRHAQQSDEDAASAAMIRLRYWRKWEVAKVIEFFYGKPSTKQEKQARQRAYYRLLDKDYEGIRAALAQAGVMRAEQI
jgi:DNA-directed RNA polymerase specialized sigma24 family protein